MFFHETSNSSSSSSVMNGLIALRTFTRSTMISDASLTSCSVVYLLEVTIGLPNAESDRRVGKFWPKSDCSQHIRRLQRGTGASRARTYGNVSDGHDHTLPLHILKRVVQDSRVPEHRITVQSDFIYLGERLLKHTAESGHMLVIALKVLQSNLTGSSEPDTQLSQR